MHCLTWEELSSSAACEDVERVSSTWPRDPTLVLPFSNLPLPLLCGGDESESLGTPSSSSNNNNNNKKSHAKETFFYGSEFLRGFESHWVFEFSNKSNQELYLDFTSSCCKSMFCCSITSYCNTFSTLLNNSNLYVCMWSGWKRKQTPSCKSSHPCSLAVRQMLKHTLPWMPSCDASRCLRQ